MIYRNRMNLRARLEKYGLQRFKGDDRHDILLLEGHIVRVDGIWEMTFDTFEHLWMLNVEGWEKNSTIIAK